jgi:histone chaperone ASF1
MSVVTVTNVQLQPQEPNPAPFGTTLKLFVDIQVRPARSTSPPPPSLPFSKRLFFSPSNVAVTRPFFFLFPGGPLLQVQSTLPEDHDLVWKVTYVADAEDSSRDQVLGTVDVGPVRQGRQRIPLEARAPDPAKIRPEEALGVTLLLITGSYTGAEVDADKDCPSGGGGARIQPAEFIRIGYYQNNEYPLSRPDLRENPPASPQWAHITRHILLERPRITRFRINWGSNLRVSAISAKPVAVQKTGGFGALALFGSGGGGGALGANGGANGGRNGGNATQSAIEASFAARMESGGGAVLGTNAEKNTSSPPAAADFFAVSGTARNISNLDAAASQTGSPSLGQYILSFLGFADIFATAGLRCVSKRFKVRIIFFKKMINSKGAHSLFSVLLCILNSFRISSMAAAG